MGSIQYLQGFSVDPTSNGRWDQWDQMATRLTRFDPTHAPMGSKARGMGSMQLAQIQAVTNTDPIDPIDPNKKQ
jgi:hypothetical protein